MHKLWSSGSFWEVETSSLEGLSWGEKKKGCKRGVLIGGCNKPQGASDTGSLQPPSTGGGIGCIVKEIEKVKV